MSRKFNIFVTHMISAISTKKRTEILIICTLTNSVLISFSLTHSYVSLLDRSKSIDSPRRNLSPIERWLNTITHSALFICRSWEDCQRGKRRRLCQIGTDSATGRKAQKFAVIARTIASKVIDQKKSARERTVILILSQLRIVIDISSPDFVLAT